MRRIYLVVFSCWCSHVEFLRKRLNLSKTHWNYFFTEAWLKCITYYALEQYIKMYFHKDNINKANNPVSFFLTYKYINISLLARYKITLHGLLTHKRSRNLSIWTIYLRHISLRGIYDIGKFTQFLARIQFKGMLSDSLAK